METLFRDGQVTQIANYLGIPKRTVDSVLSKYVGYLKGKLESGETIKFLNVCYIRWSGSDVRVRETLAYISNNIGRELGLSQGLVYRVLTGFEDFLVKDLKRLNAYTIRGLFKIRLEKFYDGGYRVRARKSRAYNNVDVYVVTLPSFKRKAELVG